MELNHGPLSYQDSVLPLNYTRKFIKFETIIPSKPNFTKIKFKKLICRVDEFFIFKKFQQIEYI